MRAYNPVGRVPALVLEDGEVLVDSAAILDHLDEVAGPERALMPASGKARRDALQRIVLATGINDKAVAIVYEGRNRGDAADAGWIARCRGQQDAALAALEARFAAEPPGGARLMQPEITVATALGYLRLRLPLRRGAASRPLPGAGGAVGAGGGPSRLPGLPADAAGDRGSFGRGPSRAFALAGRRPCSLRQP